MSEVMTRLDADALFRLVELQEAEDAAAMPDATAALVALSRARQRMQRLGWSEGIYCPKDGSEFALVQFGGSGIFSGAYVGKWPDGDIWMADETTHPQACLWKAIDKLTDAERARFDACVADHRAYIDRLGASFAAMENEHGAD